MFRAGSILSVDLRSSVIGKAQHAEISDHEKGEKPIQRGALVCVSQEKVSELAAHQDVGPGAWYSELLSLTDLSELVWEE